MLHGCNFVMFRIICSNYFDYWHSLRNKWAIRSKTEYVTRYQMPKLSFLILSSLLLSKNKFGFGYNFVRINVRYCETENFEIRGYLSFCNISATISHSVLIPYYMKTN